MNSKQIRLLIVDTDLTFIDLIIEEVNKVKVGLCIQVVQNKQQYLDALRSSLFDIVLCNYKLSFFADLEAFELTKEYLLQTPFIYYSENIALDSVISGIKKGVSDYFEISNPSVILAKIKSAIDTQKILSKNTFIEQEGILNDLKTNNFIALDSFKSSIAIIDTNGIIIKVNKSWISFGRENGSIPSNNFFEGFNYFNACVNDDKSNNNFGEKALRGIKDVINDSVTEFFLEYPCNSPDTKSWFKMRVKKIERYPNLILIEHSDISDHKKSQQKLAETTNILVKTVTNHNKILDASLDLICSFDAEGRILNVNSFAVNSLGYEPHNLIGRSIFDVVHVDDLRNSKIDFRNIKSKVPIGFFENRIYHKNGSVLDFLWSIKWDDENKVAHCIGRDETDKKNLERTVFLERKRFLDLHMQSPFCTGILKGPNHIYEMANPLTLQLIGKTDIIGLSVKEVLPESESQGIIKFLDDVYNTGVTFTANEMLIKFDHTGNGNLIDTYFNIICQAHLDSKGNRDGILFFAIDVTEQVLSRKTIEKSEKKFRQIVETAQEGIWMIDESYNTTFVNSKMAEILEYTTDEMIGKDIFFFMEEPVKSEAQRLISFKKEEYFNHLNFKFISKSGSEVWTTISANPLFNDDTTYKGSLAMVMDTTERKKNLEQLRIQNAQLTKANLELDRFVYSVSHDLRSPLTSVLGLLAFIEEETKEKDTLKHATMIRNSINRLDQFIKNILNYSRNNRLSLISEPILIESTIRTIVDSLKNSSDAQGIVFKLSFGKVKTFYSDQVRVNTILENLISNAIKHHKKDSSDKYIRIATRFKGKKLHITIADNGVGIDAVHHSKIFDMFYRVSNTTEGSGMGLYIVKDIIQNIKGSIELESIKERGTIFTVIINNLNS